MKSLSVKAGFSISDTPFSPTPFSLRFEFDTSRCLFPMTSVSSFGIVFRGQAFRQKWFQLAFPED
jgi:hypothetical protein